ncbi:MAG: EamA family transporter [Gammaproteobacteria bacterium]|nr:EamA family transporter [Gammaproteobacteria bacterium]
MATGDYTRVTRQARPLAAALYMLGACLCFAFNSVFVRYAAEDIHPFEVAFFRNFFAIGFVLLLVLPKDGLGVFKCERPGLLTLRAAINSASMLAWFFAVPLLPLADLTALGFTAPLWATLLAALVLGEQVRLRRWSATVIGFAGALLIIQPGFKDVTLPVYLVLFSSACWGVTVIVVRFMTGYERPNTILIYQCIMMSGFALLPALWFWSWPQPTTFIYLIVLGALSAGAHWCHVRAYSLQEVAALQPLDFSRLPIIALTAWWLFGEVAGLEIWAGAAIIFSAGLYISYREAQLEREGRRRR